MAAAIVSIRKTCALCARRKIRCDKDQPCSNCVKAKAECAYEPLAPPRARKRAADEDLLARLARYESLMEAHNIDFQGHKNCWVPSTYETKSGNIANAPAESSKSLSGPSQSLPTCLVNGKGSKTQRQAFRSPGTIDGVLTQNRCSWSDLCPELQYPPIQILRHPEDPLMDPTPSLGSIMAIPQPELGELHPDPCHIYRLWQIFVESVNPLIKIVHTPSLQQRILDATSDRASISKTLTAMLFAIYTLAVTSLNSNDCQNFFAETRQVLLLRYRTATLRALLQADFLGTKNMETLQALALFLFSDPDSELTSTLSSAAVRVAQKMGLHQLNSDPALSIFEREMRNRLWWQLFGLDARSRALCIPGWKLSPGEFGDVPPPLNINDTDLHPDMTEPPVKYDGPTDMMCVLMKFEVSRWIRMSPAASKVLPRIMHSQQQNVTMPSADDAINELEVIYEQKYLHKLDKCIPLHQITHCMAKLAIARMRFKIHHPKNKVAPGNSDAYMSQAEIDLVFENALTILEMIDIGIRSKFSTHLFTHMASTFQMDTYIFLISELRYRSSGEKVALAWKLIENLYEAQPQLVEEVDKSFFVAFGQLTLEAWTIRRAELLFDRRVTEAEIKPQFIRLLEEKSRLRDEQSALPKALEPQSFGLIEDDYLNWDYWNNF